ncbi:serine protease inhibitor [Calliopsis andreniformis]|uniref:serine protease inhibitor n=1 Tax=Calliopsis andreniformis TaxID=337506 RepID=UPI003FCC6230
MKFPCVYCVFIGFSLLLLLFKGLDTATILHKLKVVQIQTACKGNEVFTLCEADPSCEKSCDNIDIWESTPCTPSKTCNSGCICKEGYVRDNEFGTCVWENSCPRVRH